MTKAQSAISDLISLDSFLAYSENPHKYFLVFSRNIWESQCFKGNGYSFTKEELDAAEKLDVKLIGTRNGVDCYLTDKMK